jgi:hypothetical protein
MDEEVNEGLGRRELLKRGAMVGGAVLWTTPVVQSLASPAFAAATQAGGDRCVYALSGAADPTAPAPPPPTCFEQAGTACCDCQDARVAELTAPSRPGGPLPLAVAETLAAVLCLSPSGPCTIDPATIVAC